MVRLILALVLASTTPQTASIDPPIAGRPVDFSNIVGKYEIKVSAAPTVVRVEESIVLKVEITGEGPAKYQPKRSSLRLIPASWENDFYIHDMPAEDRVMQAEKTWVFVYRLKPKSVNVAVIPLITLHYYDPTQSEKNRFQKDYGGSIPITVTPKPDPSEDVLPAESVMPESFYERASSDAVLRAVPLYELDIARLIGWLLAPPILGTLAVWALRHLRPGQKALARRYQNEAAQRALTRLTSGPPWQVVASYLQERSAFPAHDGTPKEVERYLKRCGFALSLCQQARAFFDACDAARFTQSSAEMAHLTEAAARLIHALEADPCVRT